MARKSKQVLINGNLFEKIPKDKSGRYRQVDNPSNTISRRQAEKGELAKQGFKSFEQKAKARKAAGIPKGFRRKIEPAYKERAFYKKRVYNIGDLKEELLKINDDNYITIIRVRGKFTRDNKTGLSLLQAGHTLTAWRTLKTGYATAEYYLKFEDFYKIRKQFKREGYLIELYEITITPK